MARTHGAFSTTSQAPALQRVWQSMRVMRRFTAADLVATAEATESSVHKFVRALAHAGFVRLQVPRVSGRPGSRDVWQLARDSGPLAPICRRGGAAVYDPNTLTVWGMDGKAVVDQVAARQRRLDLAHREALRMAAAGMGTRASVDTLRSLQRQGLITLTVALTESGRALAEALPATRSQRGGTAQEAGHE